MLIFFSWIFFLNPSRAWCVISNWLQIQLPPPPLFWKKLSSVSFSFVLVSWVSFFFFCSDTHFIFFNIPFLSHVWAVFIKIQVFMNFYHSKIQMGNLHLGLYFPPELNNYLYLCATFFYCCCFLISKCLDRYHIFVFFCFFPLLFMLRQTQLFPDLGLHKCYR